MPKTDEKPSPLKEFAALIGSKNGTHPIPPDQYLTYQDKRYSPAYAHVEPVCAMFDCTGPSHRSRHVSGPAAHCGNCR